MSVSYLPRDVRVLRVGSQIGTGRTGQGSGRRRLNSSRGMQHIRSSMRFVGEASRQAATQRWVIIRFTIHNNEIIMAYRENAKILKADCLADGVYEIWFETDISGQFISVYSNDGSRMLPRPISICKVENNNLRIVFRVAREQEEGRISCNGYLVD